MYVRLDSSGRRIRWNNAVCPLSLWERASEGGFSLLLHSMITKYLVAPAARVFNFLHSGRQATDGIRLHPTGDQQFTGSRFQLSGQRLKTCLIFPYFIGRAGLISFFNLGKILPRLMGQRIKLDRTFAEKWAIKGKTATQHATQLFTGVEHVFENRFTLAQWRIGINPATRR